MQRIGTEIDRTSWSSEVRWNHSCWSALKVDVMSKRTFQPNNRRRAKTHGFRVRMRTRAGRAVLTARREKGRARLSA